MIEFCITILFAVAYMAWRLYDLIKTVDDLCLLVSLKDKATYMTESQFDRFMEKVGKDESQD